MSESREFGSTDKVGPIGLGILKDIGRAPRDHIDIRDCWYPRLWPRNQGLRSLRLCGLGPLTGERWSL